MEKLLANRHRLKLDHCYDDLEKIIQEKIFFLKNPKGNFFKLKTVLDSIPEFLPSYTNCDADVIQIGRDSDLPLPEHRLLAQKLMLLSPWRKGPFDIFGIRVDSEWQSFMKWNRLIDHIQGLENKYILDIGSSSGYYMFRMSPQKPAMVMGLEPQSWFYYQYLLLQKFLNLENIYCLPIAFNELPMMDKYFDTVFCMGILYHRKSPVGMLKKIHDRMKPDGELILENLVIRSSQNMCLFPQNRYAKMRNVYFIPDLTCMESWLKRAGFKDIRCIDINKTTRLEQRKTDWINTESLDDFLDPNDPEKTVEGYPAPVRAIFLARA